MECLEWTDGQVKNNDDPSDIRRVNFEAGHVSLLALTRKIDAEPETTRRRYS